MDNNQPFATDNEVSNDTEFNKWVDRANRIVRPLFTLLSFIVVCLAAFNVLTDINPLVLNVVWTIVSFWFGSRVITKDLPTAIDAFQRLLKTVKK